MIESYTIQLVVYTNFIIHKELYDNKDGNLFLFCFGFWGENWRRCKEGKVTDDLKTLLKRYQW